jgi:hypothetical protein
VTWYVDDGTRYKSGDWPTKPIPWFDPSQSIFEFTTRPASVPTPVPAPPCTGCPASGATSPTPGAPSPDGFDAEVQPAAG